MPYFRPLALEQALDILAVQNVRIAAGCTDLFAATSAPILSGDVLDITALAGLRGVTRNDDGWRIGATTTWTDIIEADLPPAFDALKLAAREVGSVQIQNTGTVAGNLCNASPAADGVPPLLTLDAAVELTSSGGRRVVPLGAFITAARQTQRGNRELLTAILVPAQSAGGRSTFLKLGARKYLVISIAMVAARLSVAEGRIAAAAVSVGACSAVAQRLNALEHWLTAMPLASAAGFSDALVTQHLSPIDDLRADAGYRLAAAATLVRRALAQLTTDSVSEAT